MRDSAVAERAGPAEPPPVAARPISRGLGGIVGAVLLAAGSGLLLATAFPALGWWPLAPVATAGLSLAARGRRARTAACLGLLFGLGFFVPHLHWSGIYVGALPWLALATVESCYLAAMAAMLPAAWRAPGGVAGRTLATAGLWAAQEALRDSWPFGGFPWGRLAFSQADAPTLGLAALGGAPLVSAAVAGTAALLATAVVALIHRGSAGRRLVAAVPPLVAAALVLLAGLAVPTPTAGRMIRVAAVQGSTPTEGLDFNSERRAVLDNHVRATLQLAARIAAGQAPRPDIVLWPENSSDIDPLRNPDAYQVISQAVDAIGVPTLVGAVLQEPPGHLSNAGIVWGPDGSSASGPGERYVKQHPAPFGEYIPYRSFFRHFSDKVDLVQEDFVAGHRNGRLTLGNVPIGDVICFEIAYDGLVRSNVTHGAQLLAVQTNNATFGDSDESVQQLAMSRLRAVETGRSVVHISTVGVSAIISPDGTVVRRSDHFRSQVLEADVPLRTPLTLATRLGEAPELSVAAIGLVLVAGSALRRRRAASEAVPVAEEGTR